MNALVETLIKEEQQNTQLALEKSNIFSPCNGPDPTILDQLENIDLSWRKKLELLCQIKTSKLIDLRILYVPTAMYALRSDSTSTLGKQRGRNRADGKKRRTDMILKQPELVTVGDTSNSDDGGGGGVLTTDNGVDDFPKSGKEAIREWNPHLIYVQGGNTFWLHHCMEKGNWSQDLIDACCCSTNDVYCGVSAGAILTGQSMQTACWKEWDDPSVVPGRETYEDWTYIKGLDAAGGDSFFPHMEDQWQDMVQRQTKHLVESGISTQTSSVRCVRDDDSYVVDSRQQYTTKLPSHIRNN
ncbi:hypothetical protein FRACYDRAFT_174392 [Fragilariopsis cylindrus CCMP1102]|uniref:Uncharacterized protein n=1 Tax=Fragilariopsis cylindrus CCMP1102 TaxID=635003 RepID=A0A1E7EPX1_9STRA|nr:hypothetical protein FRACYDRAFT_174392 [Fragilariopsis cylindrus CCMP1102]|eukprot:OEU07847.1 hypothetical protein FRACYDRAFT_174392 [Fragilariopsis cylindrus CCMP1102]